MVEPWNSSLTERSKSTAGLEQLQFISLQPDSVQIVYVAKHNIDDSIRKEFQRLLDLTPNDARMRTAFANALYGNGRVGDAIDEYQRALELDPEQTLALHNLVLAFLEPPRNVEAAASALGRLESIDPTYTALPTLRDRLRSARTGA